MSTKGRYALRMFVGLAEHREERYVKGNLAPVACLDDKVNQRERYKK